MKKQKIKILPVKKGKMPVTIEDIKLLVPVIKRIFEYDKKGNGA